MLKTLRKKGVAKKVLWAVAIIIIISFGFFGSASLLSNNQINYAGKIFGKKISMDKFRSTYRHVLTQGIIRYGDKYKRYMNPESDTWDQLILLSEAKKRKIKVSDEDVINAIEEYSFFQKNGTFDQTLYENILQYVLHVDARNFEEGIRDKLKIIKLSEQETQDISITEKQVFAAYKKQNEKVQISYVFIDPSNFKKEVSSTEDEIKNYFEANKSEFLKPPSINVEFVKLNFPEMPKIEDADNLPEEEKESLEQKIQSEFEQSKKDIIKKSELLYDELFEQPDLNIAAKKFGFKVNTSGFFTMEQPNLSLGGSYPLINKLFQLEQGEFTEPVETPEGIVIAKVIEKKDAYIPQYSEVKEQVREKVVNLKATELAGKKTVEYYSAIVEETNKTMLKDFPNAAKTLGLEIFQTPVFNRGQYLPKIGISKEFQEAAFALTKENPISNVVKIANGFCILHLDSYVPVDKDEFEKQKEALTENLEMERKNEKFIEFITKLRLKANLEDNLPKNDEENNSE